MTTKVELNDTVKNAIKDAVKEHSKAVITIPTTIVSKRGYHFFTVPQGAHHAIVQLIGGGGGSGGAGSGGSSNNGTSGGGGGGGGGGGDAEVFPDPAQPVSRDGQYIDLTGYQPTGTATSGMLYKHIGMYVGRGGAGGAGGRAVSGATATDGIAGASGHNGRPSFIWGMPWGVAPSHTHGGLIGVLDVEAIPVNVHPESRYVVDTSSTGATVPFAYAHGGFFGYGGLGGQSFDGTKPGNGGNGGTGGLGYYAYSAGSGGGGGSVNGTAGISPPPATASIYGYEIGVMAGVGQSGNVSGAGSGDGGDGGNSNNHRLDVKMRTTGFGGYGHDDDHPGIDFDGDLDPEPLEESSSESQGANCHSNEDHLGLSLGGGGGAAAGRSDAPHRNGANINFPKLEICDCVEITRAADGECTKRHPDCTFGTGGAGPSGGSGMFSQLIDGSAQKSGAGGSGTRGCDGAIYITVYDINWQRLSFQPLPIQEVENA